MLQGGGAYPGSKAGEMLDLVASYSANPLDPEWLLRSLGLQDARRTPYRRLSGGQQQRLSLACALVGRPELVFLDEPTAGLDAQARLLVWELVDALRRDGVSVLLTTHLMDEAEELADELVIIDHGRIVASGTPSEVTRTGAEGLLSLVAPPGLDLTRCRRHCPPTSRRRRSPPATTSCAARSIRTSSRRSRRGARVRTPSPRRSGSTSAGSRTSSSNSRDGI